MLSNSTAILFYIKLDIWWSKFFLSNNVITCPIILRISLPSKGDFLSREGKNCSQHAYLTRQIPHELSLKIGIFMFNKTRGFETIIFQTPFQPPQIETFVVFERNALESKRKGEKRGKRRRNASFHAESSHDHAACTLSSTCRQSGVSRPMGITMATTTTRASRLCDAIGRKSGFADGLVSGDGQKSAEQLRNYRFREMPE